MLTEEQRKIYNFKIFFSKLYSKIILQNYIVKTILKIVQDKFIIYKIKIDESLNSDV